MVEIVDTNVQTALPIVTDWIARTVTLHGILVNFGTVAYARVSGTLQMEVDCYALRTADAVFILERDFVDEARWITLETSPGTRLTFYYFNHLLALSDFKAA